MELAYLVPFWMPRICQSALVAKANKLMLVKAVWYGSIRLSMMSDTGALKMFILN